MTGSPTISTNKLQPAEVLRRAAQRTLARCDELALCTEQAGQITRTFCSPAMLEAQRLTKSWMQAAGLQVHFDPATNLIGRRRGPDLANHRTLLIGSHLDSVVNAGRYDGVLGVMLGLALVELLDEAGVRLPFAVDVIGFCEEEGVRFATPYIGSRALIGELTPELLDRRDAGGCTMGDVLWAFGGVPDRLADAVRNPKEIVAFLEPHIEQGPVLEQEELPIGVVTGISGQVRAGITFRGRAGHAGTVPMSGRQDALAAAAQWIGEVERIARACPGLVATVGRLEVMPNVGNVIPGEARVLLDVRHLDDAVRTRAFEEVLAAAATICRERGVTHSVDWQQREASVRCDSHCQQLLEESATDAGHKPYQLPSGAGHDAAVLAARFPVCMLFLRCAGGVSHHPDEAVSEPDVAAALDVLSRFVIKLANVEDPS